MSRRKYVGLQEDPDSEPIIGNVYGPVIWVQVHRNGKEMKIM